MPHEKLLHLCAQEGNLRRTMFALAPHDLEVGGATARAVAANAAVAMNVSAKFLDPSIWNTGEDEDTNTALAARQPGVGGANWPRVFLTEFQLKAHRPCLCPIPRCAPGVPRRRAPTPPSTRRCESRRRPRASASAPRQGEENLTGWHMQRPQPPLALRFRYTLI